jgi:hypothetical protein
VVSERGQRRPRKRERLQSASRRRSVGGSSFRGKREETLDKYFLHIVNNILMHLKRLNCVIVNIETYKNY